MIALINCLFLLNIFFMLSSSVISQPGVRLNLPVVPREIYTREANELFITLTRENRIYVGERGCTWLGLKPRLRSMHKADPYRVVVIKADGGVPHETVTRVLSAIESAGFSKVSLAVEPSR